MSTNRNAVLRYNTPDKCFSNFELEMTILSFGEKVIKPIELKTIIIKRVKDATDQYF